MSYSKKYYFEFEEMKSCFYHYLSTPPIASKEEYAAIQPFTVHHFSQKKFSSYAHVLPLHKIFPYNKNIRHLKAVSYQEDKRFYVYLNNVSDIAKKKFGENSKSNFVEITSLPTKVEEYTKTTLTMLLKNNKNKYEGIIHTIYAKE